MEVFTWVSTCSTGVVFINDTAMGEAVVPVLVPLYWQGASQGLISPIATAVAVVPTIATANAICVAAAATAAEAAIAIVVAATTTAVVVAFTTAIAATVAITVVSAPLLAAATTNLGSSLLLLGRLAGADCLAEHLKLSLYCHDVGGIRLAGFLGGSVGCIKV
jgi:hypothetical protein